MYWLIDVVAVIVLLLAIYGGFKNGLAKIAGSAFVYVFRILFLLAGALGFLLFFRATGAINGLTNFFAGILGQTDELPLMSASELLASAPNMLATAVCFLPSLALSYVVFAFLFRYLDKLTEKISLSGTLGIWDRIAGMIIAFISFFVFYAIVLAIFYSFANHGGLLYLDEVLRACPLTGLIYKNNVFVDAIDGMGFAAKIMGA